MLFVYENILIFCEDTCGKRNMRDHIRTKHEAFAEIKNHVEQYIVEVGKNLPEYVEVLKKYSTARMQLFFLYFSKYDLGLSEDEISRYPLIKFVPNNVLGYMQWMSQTIRHTARFEIFKYLGILDDQIGEVTSSSRRATIKTPIIYPSDITGSKNEIRVVSFMMAAEDLLKVGYVLRKDSWHAQEYAYQRLIEKKKIKSIRKFLWDKETSFYNNIIVSLPDNVRFIDIESNESRKIEDVENSFSNRYEMELPLEMNSICIIDGQHRVYAHYQGGDNDPQEEKIAKLRKKLHLLVTGIVFPENMSQQQRKKIESELFLIINSNAKSVSQNILLRIREIIEPLSDLSIAQRVIEDLNTRNTLRGMFELSALDESKIKTASIVRFALRYLTTITPQDGKRSLYDYWDGDKKALTNGDDAAYNNYVSFCGNILDQYFSAIKNNFSVDWSDVSSKILAVVSINGFIIAFTRQLPVNGVKDFAFYDDVFKKWSYDFSPNKFHYTSSRYRMFSDEIIKGAFGLDITSI